MDLPLVFHQHFGASPAWAWVNMFKKEMSKERVHLPMNVLN
jgi:hypothetical protein